MQLLVASGVKVVGLDVVPDRCRLAEKAGALLCAAPEGDELAAVEHAIAEASGGLGADRVFLVAGGSSNGPVELAARLARDRATVIDIGKCKLDLPWTAYYEKELEVRFSRSYGPGRYDPLYEIEGVDYPAGYVRWTERRNLACFVDLIANGDIDPEPLVSGIFPLDEAAERLRATCGAGELRGVGFLFKYRRDRQRPSCAAPSGEPTRKWRSAPKSVGVPFTPRTSYGWVSDPRRVHRGRQLRIVDVAPPHRRPSRDRVGESGDAPLAFRGQREAEVLLRRGRHRHRLGAPRRLDRCRLHRHPPQFPCRARLPGSRGGKTVFVEKPLALSYDELGQILATVDSTGNDRLMVGFNRRFSPMFQELRQRFGRASEPVLARYFVNAGPLSCRQLVPQ